MHETKRRLLGAAILSGIMLTGAAYGKDAQAISQPERKQIFKLVGLTERGGKFRDACGEAVEPQIQQVDLNGDGQPELFVTVEGTCSGGAAGAELTLLIKDNDGRWKANFGFPAGGYRIMGAKNKGFPDIEIGGPGSCFPVWRWNGKQYDIHKRCER